MGVCSSFKEQIKESSFSRTAQFFTPKYGSVFLIAPMLYLFRHN